MKRQERLSLFFTREEQMLSKILSHFDGLAGLYFGGRKLFALKPSKLKHFFTAAPHKINEVDTVFNAAEWPFPQDFFDLIFLDHPLDLGLGIHETLLEATRTLCKDGTIILTGFNKTRLCSWPVQNTFGATLGCPVKRYSSLHILGFLTDMGFATEIKYFDFCRYKFWNKVFAKIFPFLGIGFVITAKRRVIDLKPLDEPIFNFAPAKEVLNSKVQPEYLAGKKSHAKD